MATLRCTAGQSTLSLQMGKRFNAFSPFLFPLNFILQDNTDRHKIMYIYTRIHTTLSSCTLNSIINECKPYQNIEHII